MAFRHLSEFITGLLKEDELRVIDVFVSPGYEMTEIADRVSKAKGKALLFTNNGTEFPVLVNAFGSQKRMLMALGIKDYEEKAGEILNVFDLLDGGASSWKKKWNMLFLLNKMRRWKPRIESKKALCQQVVMKEPDLYKLPVLTCWPQDGGPFITLPVVHTVDPKTDNRNVGMYRMQVVDRQTTGMHWHIHKGGANHYRHYKAMGKKMPVSVILGGDPVYTYVATAPLPENVDEYLFAGFLRGEPVKLVKCLTNDLYVPADADFVIEGYIDTAEALIPEGPFGDHTGFYSLQDMYPAFHVTCITHRKKAVYPATIVGVPPQEDAYIGEATERLFLPLMQLSLSPEVLDIHMPKEGVFHNLVLVKIRQVYPGHAEKVFHSLWGTGQMMFNKYMIVVDEDIDIRNIQEVLRVIFENVSADDLYFSTGPLDVLDHASNKFARGSKLGVDATKKKNRRQLHFPPAHLEQEDINRLTGEFEEIIDVDTCMLEDYALVVFYVDKRRKSVKDLHRSILHQEYLKGIRWFLYLDTKTKLTGNDLVWLSTSNTDPLRDVLVEENVVCIDATRKDARVDGYQRTWPDIVVSSEDVIKKVDAIWNRLGLGDICISPSDKYVKFY